jgi:hypothetical protein
MAAKLVILYKHTQPLIHEWQQKIDIIMLQTNILMATNCHTELRFINQKQRNINTAVLRIWWLEFISDIAILVKKC